MEHGPDRRASSGNEAARTSFWTTMPGVLAAIAALVTAVGGLITALSLTGVLGSGDGGTGAADENAVLDGDYDVRVELISLEDDGLGANRVWTFDDPQEDDDELQTWTLTSTCPDRPCDVVWRTAGLSDKFSTLERDGGTYTGRSEDFVAKDCEQTEKADREIELKVTDADTIGGVPTATAFTGTIKIDWECYGEPMEAVMRVVGDRE